MPTMPWKQCFSPANKILFRSMYRPKKVDSHFCFCRPNSGQDSGKTTILKKLNAKSSVEAVFFASKQGII